MSLEDASSQQPSGQPAQQQQASSPQNGSAAPLIGGPSEGARGSSDGTAAAARAPAIGDNGGPDWRAVLAGEDTKAVEELSRFKTPGDFLKANRELRTKLSQRATSPQLTAESTPEQIKDYRTANGIPEIAADAPVDKILEAYGIKAPEGYEVSEAEKAMLGDYAKLANAKHISPAMAKENVGFFFRAQAAGQQAMRRLDTDRKKAWDGEIKEALGKEFEPLVASANMYLQQAIPDDTQRAEFVNARLPGGGLLGDHPVFVKLLTDGAVKNGFTDRIQASSMESGGKSLETQRSEIEGLRRTDPKLYNAPETQQRYDKVLELLHKRGSIDDLGETVRRRA